jgi:type IV fimbrial biogenesis protein FimT
MDNILRTFSRSFSTPDHKNGFTLIELIVAIAVVGILSAIALPSMSNFLVKMRVDNQISEIQRLLLTARNIAINTGKNTTICPLSGGECIANSWQGEISIFTNGANDNSKYEAPTDELFKIKEAIKTGDKLEFPYKSVTYSPSGRLVVPTVVTTFTYCPKDKANESRGIDLSISGRSYISADIDNDGKDEDRDGNEMTCT